MGLCILLFSAVSQPCAGSAGWAVNMVDISDTGDPGLTCGLLPSAVVDREIL
jgi:hypothetical protein